MAPKKSVAKAVAEPVVEVPATTTTVAPTTEVAVDDIATVFAAFSAKLGAARHEMGTLLADFRTLQKRSEKEMKAASKGKRRKVSANRAPSGFTKPAKISDQLADFLGKPKGTLFARTDVTRQINTYIRENKLQDTTNGRKINPDSKLKKLLSLKPTDELTYFNLQKYMSQHFQKAETVAAVATA
jgi:chromatin remodeling complex protein RSC6